MALKTPLLAETVVNMMIDEIKAKFNLALAEVDFQYQDGINLEPLDENSIYISDKFQALRLPAVYVLFGSQAFQYTSDPNYLNSEDECVVVVSSEGMGADILTRKMWRYGRVIFSVFNLIDMHTPDGRLKVQSIPTRLGYTDQITLKLKEKDQRFRMDAVLELKLLHYEKNLTT